MKIRVLIVDDSIFYQHRLQELLDADPSIEVVGIASNGQQAIEKTQSLKPDVITMDIEMPVMDGISAVRKIMKDFPTPVLMISSATKQGASATFEAMDAGAVDFLTKDFNEIVERREQAGRKICNMVISVAKKGKVLQTKSDNIKQKKNVKTRLENYDTLAIGASTGGPVAVQQVLKKLPQNFPLPIVIIQHMPATFTPMFAERLNKICHVSVKLAEQGDILFPGCAYIAPGGKQTVVRKKGREAVIEITEGDPSFSYRPSIDVTYESLAEVYPGKVLALILTGMGADGCEGAKKLKQGGSEVWAQDEASSVVYGMPMAVAKAGLTNQILSIEQMSDALSESSSDVISEALIEEV